MPTFAPICEINIQNIMDDDEISLYDDPETTTSSSQENLQSSFNMSLSSMNSKVSGIMNDVIENLRDEFDSEQSSISTTTLSLKGQQQAHNIGKSTRRQLNMIANNDEEFRKFQAMVKKSGMTTTFATRQLIFASNQCT